MTLTTHNKSYKIEFPSFENYIKSEKNSTFETSKNLNAIDSTISLNKGDVIDVSPDFKLDITATSLYLYFKGPRS